MGSLFHNEILEGAGADGACIEPVYEWCVGDSYPGDPGEIRRIPFLEVNVKVLVKMKGMDKPVLLCRNYLPEIKEWDASEFEESIKKTKPYADKMSGHDQLREYQTKRIYDYCQKIFYGETFNKYACTGGTTWWWGDWTEYSYSRLFDGNPGTFWQSSPYKAALPTSQDNVIFVEFYVQNPLHVTSYTLTTVNDEDGMFNPKSWKLYARKSQNGEWSIIDERAEQQLPASNARATYEVSNSETWQYFRFEVSGLAHPGSGDWNSDLFRLAELELNGD